MAAQAPFAGQGAQMPDPKAMSGLPLPVPDVPVAVPALLATGVGLVAAIPAAVFYNLLLSAHKPA